MKQKNNKTNYFFVCACAFVVFAPVVFLFVCFFFQDTNKTSKLRANLDRKRSSQ